jgi:tetratricopeptide (TPR) repeat protein
MIFRSAKIVSRLLSSLLLFNLLAAACNGQSPAEEPAPPASPIESLGLVPAQVAELRQSINAHDYIAAEKLLLAEIGRDPHSAQAARLLAYAGSVYFLNHDYINAAIAWKKSDAISPLDARLQFSLAMAYIRIARPDWARAALESLAAANPKESLYPYWLGRLDYDGHEYINAEHHFQRAIDLAPQMARAYDNLGLCYYYENHNDLAIENYKKAIDLESASPHPSPWPYLNLAITEQFINQFPNAEADLRQAIRLDPGFAQAHFRLGIILEDLERPQEAVAELREAARIDPLYPEPHLGLARIYHKLGQEPQAREEVQTYLRLHGQSIP